MRNRCLFLVFFVSLFVPIKRELYIPSMVNRKNQNDYEKLMDSYKDLTDAEYMALNYNNSDKTHDKKSYDLNISSLTPASNYNGAVEFSLGYLICGPERRGVYCPTF